ncbi:hypothetical protein AC625_17115 [Peribacillus loiseleuriae]|uniref:Uncharacterized protein n=1 Tax=Peribacillus loiseleuriae TaxID=1679170 RepID=A0A0K9GWG8_9BACI|nr:hypothetical protein AC625_17115 [Peribacillus loiseleuriae]
MLNYNQVTKDTLQFFQVLQTYLNQSVSSFKKELRLKERRNRKQSRRLEQSPWLKKKNGKSYTDKYKCKKKRELYLLKPCSPFSIFIMVKLYLFLTILEFGSTYPAKDLKYNLHLLQTEAVYTNSIVPYP